MADDANGGGSDAGPDRGAGAREEGTVFATLTGDFYRGEIERTASWRGRLDQTTNWAVVVVGAILTWAFSSPDNPHYVILIGVFGVTAFLVMEANRYREYDVWRRRVRTLQSGLYAQLYAPDESVPAGWRADLAADLRDPTFQIPFASALGHRLRRSYFPLLLILLAAWLARITVFEAGETWRETASILGFPGEVVVGLIALFYGVALAVVAWSARGPRVQEFQE